MKEIFIYAIGILLLSWLLFYSSQKYLEMAKSIHEPVTSKGQMTIVALWLLMATVTCSVILLGMKVVDYSGISLNRAAGVIPVAGMVIHFIKYRVAWKEYHLKFGKKG